MNIIEIYKKYEIPSFLGEHMIRVAAVAKWTCMHLQTDADEGPIIEAALLHDMGNIIKFDLGALPLVDTYNSRSLEEIQRSFLEKYGNEEHEATFQITQEVTSTPEVRRLVNGTGFRNAYKMLESNDLGAQILQYADMRVLPTRVGTLAERFDEGEKRYGRHPNKKYIFGDTGAEIRDKNINALYQIESLLFEGSTHSPEDISDKSCEQIIQELQSYELN